MLHPDYERYFKIGLACLICIAFAIVLTSLQGCENPSCTKDFDPPDWCDNLVGDDQPDSPYPWDFPWMNPEEREPGDLPLDDGPDATCTSADGPHPCPNNNGNNGDDGAPGSGSDDDDGDDSGGSGEVDYECDGIHICWKGYDRCVRPLHPLAERNHQHVSPPPCTLGPWHGQEKEHEVHEGACPR